ncbi:MAG: thiolase family protein [Acidobacteriota bacterium]
MPRPTPSLRRVVLVDGCRTPFQKVSTGFGDLMSYQLASAAIRGLLERTGLSPGDVERILIGGTVHNPRTNNVAREAALDAGLPASVPALTVTAAGASATAAVSIGADLVATGQVDAVIAGGSDCISDPPIGFRRSMRRKLLRARRLRGARQWMAFLSTLRPGDFLPEIPDITEFSTGETMGQYAEGLARRLGITRADQDAYAAESHRRAAEARSRGLLAPEIVPVETADGTRVGEDNGIRPGTDAAALGTLEPSFARGGSLTAGNSSFLTDGAAVVLLMAEERARALGLTPRARLLASTLTAHDPKTELLLGPAFAIPKVLNALGLSLGDIDVFEIHEAFAAQILAVLRLLASDDFAARQLGRGSAVGTIPPDRLNAWGGSLALGNPFAPNGARLLTTAAHRLWEEDADLAMVATCAGGALGQAMVLERAEIAP